MPWSGSSPNQSFSRSDGIRTGTTVFQQEAAASTGIQPTLMDTHENDIVTGVNALLKRDGGNQATGNLQLGGYNLTNVGAATAGNQVPNVAQIQNGSLIWGSTAGGTASALTLTLSPAPGGLTAGLTVAFMAAADCAGATTIAINGLTAVALTRQDGAALQAKDYLANQLLLGHYDGTQVKLVSFAPSQIPAGTPYGGYGTFTNLASASTTDLGTIASHFVNITGTTTITALGSSAATSAPIYLVQFAGAMTLTYNATSLILPGAANITTVANDFAVFQYLGSGNWSCLSYFRASGQPVAAIAGSLMQTGKILVTSGSLSGSSLDISIPSDAQEIEIELEDAYGTNNSAYGVSYKVGGSAVNTGYTWSLIQFSGSTVTGSSNASASAWTTNLSSISYNTAAATNFLIRISGVQSGPNKHFNCTFQNGSTTINVVAGSCSTNTGLISDIVITPASGSFGGGTYRVYKIK